MDKISEGGAASSPLWETLEGYAREQIQQFVQRLLKEEVDALLGRQKRAAHRGDADRLSQRSRQAPPARADLGDHHPPASPRARPRRALREPRPAPVPAPHAGDRRAAARALLARPLDGRLRTRPARPPGGRRAAVGQLDPAPQDGLASPIRRLALSRAVGLAPRVRLGRWDLRQGGAGRREGRAPGAHRGAGRWAQGDPGRRERPARVDRELGSGAARPEGARPRGPEAHDRRRAPWHLGRARAGLAGERRTAVLRTTSCGTSSTPCPRRRSQR